MFNKKMVIKITSFVLLFLITYGSAFLGIAMSPKNVVVYNGIKYRETGYMFFENKQGHTIQVSIAEESGITTLEVENDDVIITIDFYNYNYEIKRDSISYNGKLDELLDSEQNHAYKDYIKLVHSYFEYTNMMDEFPESIIFPFLATFPFFFGLIFLLDIFKKRNRKVSIMHYSFRYITLVLFLGTLYLEFLSISRNV